MNISQVGINLIKSFEGLELTSYKVDGAKEEYFTIGHGHYGADVKEDQKITPKQAEELLVKDLQKFVDGVNKLLKVPVNQNQFDALISFSFNLGLGNTEDLTKLINKNNFAGASKLFPLYCHAGGQVLKGLVIRRKAEQTLFLKQVEHKEIPLEKYKVRSGDNLTKISKKYRTTIKHIQELNPSIKDKNVILIEQIIKVPKI
jgi:lysozyme